MSPRLPALLLCLALTPSCADEPDAAPVPKHAAVETRTAPSRNRPSSEDPPPPAEHPPLVEGPRGNWRPVPSHLELAKRLGPAATRDQVDELLDALPPNERIDVLRGGLRLADEEAARAAAARLLWSEVDGWESARVVELQSVDAFLEDSEADFGEFRSILGSSELPLVLENLPPLPWGVAPAALSHFHRHMRAEHIPLYARLSREAPEEIAKFIRSDLWLLAQYSDRYRDDIARAYLGDAADALPATSPGLPPLLAASLSRFFVDAGTDGAMHKRADWISQWLLRWLNDSTPRNADAPLLVECARADNGLEYDRGFAEWSLFLALGRLDDSASRAFLVEEMECDNEAAIAALALRGDADALAMLREEPFDHLHILLEVEPERTRRVLETVVRGPSREAAMDAMDSLAEARRLRNEYGLDWPDRALGGFERDVLGGDVAAAPLVSVALSWPGCRTRHMAAAAVERVASDEALAAFVDDLEHAGDGYLAFLEVGAPDAWRARLRRAITGRDETVRQFALDQLLTLGDPPSGSALFAYWLEKGDDEWPILRSPSPELEAHLRTLAEGATASGAVNALAVLYGLPAPWHEHDDLIDLTDSAADEPMPPEDFARIRELVLDRKPFDALEGLLRLRPHEQHFGIGRVKRDFVRDYLEGIRKRRDLRVYPWATAELAVWGDPAARAEHLEALRIGRYRWMSDQAEPHHLLLPGDPDALEFLISEQETNCCRVVMGSGNALEAYYGIDDLDVGYSTPRRQTLYEAVRRYFDDARGDWTWSHVAGHYVPTPR